MARRSRIHAHAPGAIRQQIWNFGSSGPIAPQIHRLRRAFRLEKPLQGRTADPDYSRPQTLISARNFLGCHGISSVKETSAVPQTGSALHHLVTSVSIKKALMGWLQLPARPAGDASRTHSDKMRSEDPTRALRRPQGKGIVNEDGVENASLPFSCPVLSYPMSLGSFASAGIDSKRRALPLPGSMRT